MTNDNTQIDAYFGSRILFVQLMFLMLLAVPIPVGAEPKLIAIEECELNGFSLGGTIEEMRNALGKPRSITPVKNPAEEYPYLEAHYEGLRIVFSTQGQSALSYFITSDKYRLRSGVGVGSTRQDIEAALGQTSYYKVGGTVYMIYRLAGPSGNALPVQFDVRLDGDLAVGLSLVSR